MSIGGPGAIHLLNGLYDAKIDHAPVVAIFGQVQSHLLNTWFFQEFDTPNLCADVAVYNKLVTSPATLPQLMDEAIRMAYKYQCISVLTIPDDIPDHKIADNFQSTAGQFQLQRPQAQVSEVDQVLRMLQHVQKPLVLLGTGAPCPSSCPRVC